MSCGIYKILNLSNNKFYIGSTINLNKRKSEHNCKNNSFRGNSIIRSAILKYGTSCFKFEVLEEFIFTDFANKDYKLELLTSREQYYVDILMPQYNIKKEDVTSNRGYSTYLKVNDTRRIKIDVYITKDLSFVETIDGIRECSRLYNIDSSQIVQICKKGYTLKYNRDFIFCYHGTDVHKLLRNFSKFTFKRKDTTPVIQIDNNSKFIKEWRTGSDAEKELKLYRGSISRVLSGEYKHVKNYYFIHKN